MSKEKSMEELAFEIVKWQAAAQQHHLRPRETLQHILYITNALYKNRYDINFDQQVEEVLDERK